MARDHDGAHNPNFVVPASFPDTYPMTVSCHTVCDSVPSGSFAGSMIIRHNAANIAWSIDAYAALYNLFVTGRTNSHTAANGVKAGLVAVFNGASSKLYNNGVLASGNPGALAIGAAAGRIEVGNRNDFGSPMDGRICEMAVWNVELTTSEVAALWRAVNPRIVRPLALQAYWPYWGITYPEYDFGPLKLHFASAGGNPAVAAPHFAGSPIAI